jgi:glycosyltransferase involved in cell wall biosynthesis
VLALATYPVEAAASRYRVVQFIDALSARGIDVTFSPFLDSALFASLYDRRRILQIAPRLLFRLIRRFRDVLRSFRCDVLWVQREAMLVGPPLIEWLITRVLGRPMVLDLDDATYIPLTSPVYGRLATLLKWPSKTDTLLRWSATTVAGSPAVAEYATAGGSRTFLIPTLADLGSFTPAEKKHAVPVVGWIGSHSTFQYVEKLLPVFERLAREHRFILRIVGSSRRAVSVPGAEVDLKAWRMNEEVEDFRSLDIGVYPLSDDEWSAGKAGFKAIQYMAAGIPFVASPVGVCATIGNPGETHLLARTADEWFVRLDSLLRDERRRVAMGHASRSYAEKHFALEPYIDLLADILRTTAARKSR